jgi:hypothetical protein
LFAAILGNSYAGNTFTNDIAAFEVPGGTSATTDVTVSGNVAECYGPCVSLSQNEQDIIISNNEFRIMANSVKGDLDIHLDCQCEREPHCDPEQQRPAQRNL